jgi:hypothetical protein
MRYEQSEKISSRRNIFGLLIVQHIRILRHVALAEVVKRPMKAKTPQRKKTQTRTPRRKKNLVEQYETHFRPVPMVWTTDDDDFSLEQPTPFKVFPTETTYSIADSMFCVTMPS